MADRGIEAVFLTTHNWGKSAKSFEDTHYGTREMTVRDPDGRTWNLQAQK